VHHLRLLHFHLLLNYIPLFHLYLFLFIIFLLLIKFFNNYSFCRKETLIFSSFIHDFNLHSTSGDLSLSILYPSLYFFHSPNSSIMNELSLYNQISFYLPYSFKIYISYKLSPFLPLPLHFYYFLSLKHLLILTS
jgi:hypothetical protein